MAWLIIQNDPDRYGLIPEPTRKHFADYTKALSEFERLVKVENRRVRMFTDPEYQKLYFPDEVST